MDGAMFSDSFSGVTGFDNLRKYIKQGNEFCRELSGVMQERADLESGYAKTLSKISAKLTKAANGCIGTLADSWSLVAAETESESEIHRQLSQSLIEDVYKPLKILADSQQKIRKPIEGFVEKTFKLLTDKRADESKCKKCAFNFAREREKLSEQILNSRNNRAKFTDKEITKMEKRLRALEGTMMKGDRDYHDLCLKAEASRQEWESAVAKGAAGLQSLEEDRITQLRDLLNKYNTHLAVVGPKLISSTDKLAVAALNIDVTSDLRSAIDQRATGPNQPEQILPDYYAEDMQNVMDLERRHQALQNYSIYLQQDLERESKGKEGVEKLAAMYESRPTFADAEAQEETRTKLRHVSMMVSYVEAASEKVRCALADVNKTSRPACRFSQYLERSKDKQGQCITILRLPMSMTFNRRSTVTSATYRQPADGRRVESPVNFSDDEFDASPPYTPPIASTPIGECRAIYEYIALQFDELTIKPGDVITVYDKQEDGWWQGELGGRIGIFPATYVEVV